MAYQKLDKLDKQILRMIAEDARVPFLEVARACNVSGAAIHQRIQKLTSMGIIKGSKFIIDPEKIGYETCAFIGLNLKNPESFDEVLGKLKEIPEVVESSRHHPRQVATSRSVSQRNYYLIQLRNSPPAANNRHSNRRR